MVEGLLIRETCRRTYVKIVRQPSQDELPLDRAARSGVLAQSLTAALGVGG